MYDTGALAEYVHTQYHNSEISDIFYPIARIFLSNLDRSLICNIIQWNMQGKKVGEVGIAYLFKTDSRTGKCFIDCETNVVFASLRNPMTAEICKEVHTLEIEEERTLEIEEIEEEHAPEIEEID
jgi:hypothetical protein